MFENIPPLFYAFAATVCFAYSSTIFTEFARKISPFWMNSFKAFVALIAFWITILLTKNWVTPNIQTVTALLSSGCIGLMIGDIFMLHAMKELGASRMLMIFGLQPFFLSIGGYFFFGQVFSWMNFLGVLAMLGCLYTISLENYKRSGDWQLRGMLLGVIAIILDAIGVLLSRYGFNSGISPVQLNGIRCVGAVLGFFVINYFFYPPFKRVHFKFEWKLLDRNERIKIFIGSIGGTYFSLLLYLTAVSKGNLGVISSVSVTGPMFSTMFECFRLKKLPSVYLIISFIFFLCGFLIFYRS